VRKIKHNIWGNWNGYVGSKRTVQFGTDDVAAAYWLLTGNVDFNEGYSTEWLCKCKDVIAKL
jgi:hypothetical protein